MSKSEKSGEALGNIIGIIFWPIAAILIFSGYDLTMLRIKAVLGNPSAQLQLASAYRRGDFDLEKDIDLSIRWNDKAAENGQAVAQYNKYARLQEDDRRTATHWLKLSAEGGYYAAQTKLAVLHEQGNFVRQDLVEAYAWHSFAAASGIGASIKRMKEMQTNLHRDVILKGDERAREIQKTIDARIATGSLTYKESE